MAAHGVVSADSHMMEPADLWQERLDRRFRDRAPKVIENPESRAWIDKNFDGVPDAVRRKIVYSNAVDLYRMNLDPDRP